MVIEPGMVCYDEFLSAFYLVVQREPRGPNTGRPYLRMIELETGVEKIELERMMIEDPDIEWLT